MQHWTSWPNVISVFSLTKQNTLLAVVVRQSTLGIPAEFSILNADQSTTITWTALSPSRPQPISKSYSVSHSFKPRGTLGPVRMTIWMFMMVRVLRHRDWSRYVVRLYQMTSRLHPIQSLWDSRQISPWQNRDFFLHIHPSLPSVPVSIYC